MLSQTLSLINSETEIECDDDDGFPQVVDGVCGTENDDRTL